MDCSGATFNLSNAMCQRITQRREDWENNFEKNKEAFSRHLTKGIMSNVVLKLKETFKDGYRQVPSREVPLASYFSFEIVNSKDAIALKELAEEGADLPPFKEWFERFSIPNQKLSDDNDFSSAKISSGFVRFPEREKGIDREYFQDMMALIGRSVELQLKELFKSFTSLPENSLLKTEVLWYRKADQLLSNPSNFHDNSIDVKIWIEDRGIKQLDVINSVGSGALVKQRENRRIKQCCTQMFNIAGYVFAASLIFFLILYPSNSVRRS